MKVPVHSLTIIREILFFFVNIHRNVGMDFLTFPGKRNDIEWHDLQGSYSISQYTPCSLGNVLGNIALGTVFLDTHLIFGLIGRISGAHNPHTH